MHGGDIASGGLTALEVREFARVFADVAEAVAVLEDAGFARGSQPFWNASSAVAFWTEVSRQLGNGLVADGRVLLFDEACRRYPANPVFVAGSSRESGVARLVPSAGLLPARPSRFMAREADLELVRHLLTAPSGGPVVGLLGMGGAGKSTLARELIHDPQVRAAFPDGIVWVDVSPEPDFGLVVAEVLAAFGDVRPVLDVADAVRRLRILLAGARCLVVLDDVWHVDVLDAVRVPYGVRLLVTSRNREALYTGSARHLLGPAAPDRAREMLAAHAACRVDALPSAAEDVIELCGGLPLALALAGGLVADDWEWSEVADALAVGDFESLAGRFEDGYQYRDLLAALDASIWLLPDDEADRFRELAVFKGSGPVPASVVTWLWNATSGTTPQRGRELLRRFSGRSLVRFDPLNHTVILHDLLIEYTRVTSSASRFTELHGILAGALLDRWGGLARRLPGLRDTRLFDDIDRYGLSALVSHLLAAGRRDVLDELLTVDWPEPTGGAGRADNAWYTVHENVGRTGDYVTAVRAVLRDANSSVATQGGQNLARQVTCALVLGSISSIARNIPPELLRRLVAEGVWPPARALAYAQSNPDTADRALALSMLVQHLPADQRGPTVGQALSATASIRPYSRALALSMLAPHLPADRRRAALGQALAAAASVVRPYSRALALCAVAAHLSDDQLGSALDVAAAIDEPDSQALALAGLAPYLPHDLRHAAAAMARTGVGEMPDGQAAALSSLPAQLTPAQLAAALAEATAIDRPFSRVRVLSGLAPYLPADQLGLALASATTIDNPQSRARALVELTPRLPAEQRGLALGQALAAAMSVVRPYSRARVLCALVPQLRADERGPVLGQALAAAAEVDNPCSRAEALAGLALLLPDGERTAVLGRALDAAKCVESPDFQADVLAGLVPRLPAGERGAVVARALTAAAAVGDPDARADVLVGLAPWLAADLLGSALDMAGAIDDPCSRARALAGLAPYLPADRWRAAAAAALSAAAAVDDPYSRSRAMTELAPSLPPEQRDAVLDGALATVVTIDHPRSRAGALCGLAPHLPARLLAQALTVAAAVDDPPSRARALCELVSRLPAAERRATLGQTLAAASLVSRAAVVSLLPMVLGTTADVAVSRAVTSALLNVQRWWP